MAGSIAPTKWRADFCGKDKKTQFLYVFGGERRRVAERCDPTVHINQIRHRDKKVPHVAGLARRGTRGLRSQTPHDFSQDPRQRRPQIKQFDGQCSAANLDRSFQGPSALRPPTPPAQIRGHLPQGRPDFGFHPRRGASTPENASTRCNLA